jgi:plasmid stabilization system protein ParE
MRTVFWNRLAETDYFLIIDYLLLNWSTTSAQNFINQVDKIESMLESGNVDFESTNRKNIRRCVLSKQVTMYYKTFGRNSIELLRFLNNYQDKNKVKF